MQILSSKKKATKCLKTWIWEGLGLYLGTVWAVFWALLGAFSPFFECSKLIFFQPWVQDGVQKAFWIDFGTILEGSGNILGTFSKGLAGFWIDFEGFWEGLADLAQVLLCQGPRAVSRSPAERPNARGSLPLRVLDDGTT